MSDSAVSCCAGCLHCHRALHTELWNTAACSDEGLLAVDLELVFHFAGIHIDGDAKARVQVCKALFLRSVPDAADFWHELGQRGMH